MHYKNLSFILQNGLICPAEGIKDENYINIGKKDIIDKREKKIIEIEPGGRIHDYVSFYFGPKSPMLYSIHQGNSDTNCSQKDIIYIVIGLPDILKEGLKFVFTTGQAIMQLSTQHNDITDLSKIDWDIISAKYWFDRPPEYVDRARKRMAELLIYKKVPVHCIKGIGVMDDEIKAHVERMVYDQGLLIPVKTVTDWYY